MLTKLTISFLLVAALGGTALAGDGKHLDKKVDKVFARLDADKDGFISRAEADAAGPRLAKHFDVVDANKDGYVTKAELRAAIDKLKDKKKDR